MAGERERERTYHEVSNGAVEDAVVIVTIPTVTNEVLTRQWNLHWRAQHNPAHKVGGASRTISQWSSRFSSPREVCSLT